MPTTRRRFLTWLGGSSMFAAAAPAAAMSASGEEERGHPAPADGVWDVSWADRIQGKYRAVFDSPEVSEGAALVRAVAWTDHYKEVYAAARTEMSPVIVFRHAAVPLVMKDEYWKQFKAGKELKFKVAGGKWAEVNPMRAAAPGAPPAASKYTLEKFLADGGIVLVCNWAFGRIVEQVRKADKLEGPAATERAKALLVPGVILQPNGIFAALRAQEAGCKYILAS